ncbi:MAG: TlyA family RNA methyltransferase [Candidatus Poribacteria bacterium]|jgi:23S rRNA (cytidine1920-2'-O)/16S rRNA (cytidine1409-2'-O)-methyltransferase|nr:TlyA family RNA methyltransferase [Candidatus Poribacteria bacterium]|tara:strand:+ start:718 stop:1548 length:831 start_codon:yes stop_codon:yes gene_type:complete
MRLKPQKLKTQSKERLDVLISDRGLTESREKARRLILAGEVSIGGNTDLKPGQLFPLHTEIDIRETPKYVGRGGIKLEKAIRDFELLVDGMVAIDVGASTGGFTDCLLQNGAKFVYAIDVGYGQLAWKLRQDSRVDVIERTNIRRVSFAQFSLPIDIAVIDVSFISLKKVIPTIIGLIKPTGDILALVKPQFEVGRGLVEKGGVIRDPQVHTDVLHGLIEFIMELNLFVMAISFSPIRGAAGNIEFFIWMKYDNTNQRKWSDRVKYVVQNAHLTLS